MGTSRPTAPTWRLARSLVALRAQINVLAPQRRTASDGSIGDAAHASRNSDHNPWIKDADGLGVVSAIDVTHDLRAGCDAQRLVDALVRSRDPRIKYLIFNRRICSSIKEPWTWRPYTGSNPHNKHCHVSVVDTADGYDSTAAWELGRSLS